MSDHDAAEVFEGGADIELGLGFAIHPEGYYPNAELTDVQLLRGPYGPWFRFSYATGNGTAHALISPRYEPGSQLHEIAVDAFGQAPEVLKPSSLIGQRVPCWVTHVLEHGAEVASASRLDRRLIAA